MASSSRTGKQPAFAWPAAAANGAQHLPNALLLTNPRPRHVTFSRYRGKEFAPQGTDLYRRASE